MEPELGFSRPQNENRIVIDQDQFLTGIVIANERHELPDCFRDCIFFTVQSLNPIRELQICHFYLHSLKAEVFNDDVT